STIRAIEKGTFMKRLPTQSISILIVASLVWMSGPSQAVEPSTLPVSIQALRVPNELGSLSDHWLPGSGASPQVVFIQDLHLHYPTQKRILKILEWLKQQGQLKQPIAVEGVEGAFDTSSIASYPAGPVKSDVVDYFLKKGELSGDEAYSVLS